MIRPVLRAEPPQFEQAPGLSQIYAGVPADDCSCAAAVCVQEEDSFVSP